MSSLTYNDLKNGDLLYRGQIRSKFYFQGTEVFKTETGRFYIRTDHHFLPSAGFFPEVEVYNIKDAKCLIFLTTHIYTFIEEIKVIESKIVEPFEGFEPNKTYTLENGQTWQQVSGPHAPGHHSSGYVKIIDDSYMVVDSWDFLPRVKLISS
jgi:hypothetical protein